MQNMATAMNYVRIKLASSPFIYSDVTLKWLPQKYTTIMCVDCHQHSAFAPNVLIQRILQAFFSLFFDTIS